MSIYRLISIAVIMLSCGCVSKLSAQLPVFIEENCIRGELCDIPGELNILRGAPASVAYMDLNPDGCYAISLPEELYGRRALDRRQVVVSGIIYNQPSGSGILSYELRDRLVAAGVCETGQVMYVTEIRTLDGKAIWPIEKIAR